MLTKHNLASIVVQQMVQCLLNWIFPLLSTIVVIVGDCVHIYHPRANLCTTLMTAPSPPMVGEDCLEGVETVRAAQGLSRRLLDLSCLPIQLAETGSACPILGDCDQSPSWSSRWWRWRRGRRWWLFKLWRRWLGFLLTAFFSLLVFFSETALQPSQP